MTARTLKTTFWSTFLIKPESLCGKTNMIWNKLISCQSLYIINVIKTVVLCQKLLGARLKHEAEQLLTAPFSSSRFREETLKEHFPCSSSPPSMLMEGEIWSCSAQSVREHHSRRAVWRHLMTLYHQEEERWTGVVFLGELFL